MMNLENFLKENQHLGYEIKERKARVAATTSSRKRSSGIKEEELSMMFADIVELFGDKVFQNKNLKEFDLHSKWELSSRQTPSRLKKLVEQGLLLDHGGKPKSYQVKA